MTPSRVAGPPVVPGQHSREILEELGCTPEEITDLILRSVTSVPDLPRSDEKTESDSAGNRL